MRVILKGKPGASLRPHRFSCYFYTTDYYPVCEGGQVEKIKNGRRRELILNISCERIWIPGKYILIIRDDLDCLSVMRIDFSLDEGIPEKPRPHLVREYTRLLFPMRQRQLDRCVAHAWCRPNEASCHPQYPDVSFQRVSEGRW